MCTGIRFTSTDGAMYLGRNLDWSTPFGEHIVITPKGYPLAKAFPEESTTKPAGHAIIGMGITDQGYPLYFDCGKTTRVSQSRLKFSWIRAIRRSSCTRENKCRRLRISGMDHLKLLHR